MPKREPALRRSTRDRHAVYSSLMENCIGIPGGADMFESLLVESRRRHGQEKMELSENRYPSRRRSSRTSGALQLYQECDEDTEEHEAADITNDENVLLSSSRTRSGRHVVIVRDENSDEPENSTNRRHPLRASKPESPKEEPVFTEEEGISLYERVKRRRQQSNGEEPPAKRHHPNKSIDGFEEGEEDDVAIEGQRYYFRRNRAQVIRLQDEFARQSHHRSERSRHHRGSHHGHRRSHRRIEYRPSRRRSSSSSSTSSATSDSDAATAQNDLHAEARFERRKLKSLAKGRSRFLPVNMSHSELTHAQSLNHLTSQHTAGDLNGVGDIEPMTVDKSTTFTQIGGLESHIQSLKEVVAFPLLYPDLFCTFGINAPKGVLFYGPPGTGKTLMARALANECSKDGRKVAFFMRKGADCLSKWVGESERQLRLLFDQAYQMRPSIIFFDEIDGLAPVRSSRQDQIHSSIVSTLLALMDGLDNRGQVVIIGATNRLDSLDPALRRPGRFDRELRFDLPDVTSRESILNIHTEAWNEMKPSPEDLKTLAIKTSGYCGADLKALCSEAVLVAVRMRFPHIYISDEKLELDTSTLKVEKWHFTEALRRIVPASRRDLTNSSFATDHRLDVLITPTVNKIVENLPKGYICRKPVNVGSEIQTVVESLKIPPAVPSARILLYADGNFGQSRYFINSLISTLDHLPVFTFSMGKLFANSQPEENLSAVILDITRATARGVPALLSIPDIDLLQKSLSASLWHMLLSALQSFDGFTPLLVIASVKTPYSKCSSEIKSIFPKRNALEIAAPLEEQRRQFFKQIAAEAMTEPTIFDAEKYPTPPKAKVQNAGRRMTEPEIKKLEESYEQMLRQFRIFLRDMLGRLVRDRRFSAFHLPVDVDDAADYYEIITEPMSLSEMMLKIDKKEYSTKDEFLKDIALIRANALEYNPANKMEDRVIRHNAMGLMDMAEALFDTEMDGEFELKMRKTAELISEMKETPAEKPKEDSATSTPRRSIHSRTENKNKLLIDKHQMDIFTDKATRHTENWDISQIESLGVHCIMKIQEFTNSWDRQQLPEILNTELDNFTRN